MIAITKRDGNFLDRYGACKVCDGEIPYGHTENCDIWKLECLLRDERAAKERAEHGFAILCGDLQDCQEKHQSVLAELAKFKSGALKLTTLASIDHANEQV